MSHKLTNSDRNAREAPVQLRSSGAFGALVHEKRVASLVVLAGFALLAVAGAALALEYHSNPWLLSWIPPTCCVTNDCCWEISENEVRSLPNDEWEVRSTGQIRKRTDWSPDGKFYRCACDYDNDSRHWIKHQGANTRCLFVPMRTAAR
jgi:hypothetical protein